MWRELFGIEKKPASVSRHPYLELIEPRRGFAEVVLPPATRQQLYEALTQIEKHGLIFSGWGLGERHPTGLGLVFNFAGPPGTGKTICAEAVAVTLGRKLLRVNYAELESCWAGETGKNIRNVFRDAKALDAVLFFDEADSVASRRFTGTGSGYEREANQSVNILLKEVEEHPGVVIFATNLAANFDPAFERRIRTHILFRMPDAAERERIWRVQVHPDKTPLADDVDFGELADLFPAAGGDIRNAVLKAATIAAAEEGEDADKCIHQRHFIAAMEQVVSGKDVMSQNAVDPLAAEPAWKGAVDALVARFAEIDADIAACRTELGQLSEDQSAQGLRLEAAEGARSGLGSEIAAVRSGVKELQEAVRSAAEAQSAALALRQSEEAAAMERIAGRQQDADQAVASLRAELSARLAEQERRLARSTLLPWPRPAVAAAASVLALALLALGALGGHLLFP